MKSEVFTGADPEISERDWARTRPEKKGIGTLKDNFLRAQEFLLHTIYMSHPSFKCFSYKRQAPH